MNPNEAIEKAYSEMIKQECIEKENNRLWGEVYGGYYDCPMCFMDWSDKSCSCHINPPCSYCTRECDCEHTLQDCLNAGYDLPKESEE